MLSKISIYLFVLSVVLFTGCKKNNTTQSNVPYQPVYIKVYPNDPLNSKLQSVGGWIYVAGGVNGIIVYRQSQSGSSDFISIERTSTYLPNDANARVKVLSDNFTLKDTVSGSTWQINNGAVLNGPASLPLRQYATTYDSGSGTIVISN